MGASKQAMFDAWEAEEAAKTAECELCGEPYEPLDPMEGGGFCPACEDKFDPDVSAPPPLCSSCSRVRGAGASFGCKTCQVFSVLRS